LESNSIFHFVIYNNNEIYINNNEIYINNNEIDLYSKDLFRNKKLFINYIIKK